MTGKRCGEETARWKFIPKIELHAHINGCVRPSTLLELASAQGRSDVSTGSIILANETLADCFRIMSLIHTLTADHAVVTRITKEAIEDFVADNVVYVELRTTPKHNEAHGMTRRSYVEAVLAGFEAAGVSPCFRTGSNNVSYRVTSHVPQKSDVPGKSNVYVRLLLSIDRRQSAEAAMDTVGTAYFGLEFKIAYLNDSVIPFHVDAGDFAGLRLQTFNYSTLQVQLAWEMRNRGVVGIDFSGDPAIGQWETFLPALNWAKQHGLPLSVHCGEVSNPEEVRAMLALQPQRLGHVCFLDEPEWSALLKSKIPVEICLTSNVRSGSVHSVAAHHYAALLEANHPTLLCTDDPGLFCTSLSQEYSLAATAFGLSEVDFLTMGKNAVSYTFAEEQLRSTLQEFFDNSLTNIAQQQK